MAVILLKIYSKAMYANHYSFKAYSLRFTGSRFSRSSGVKSV